MEDRGIREEDIREVLDYAESTGRKLYVEGEEHYLAAKKIGNFTCNVEYAVSGGEGRDSQPLQLRHNPRRPGVKEEAQWSGNALTARSTWKKSTTSR